MYSGSSTSSNSSAQAPGLAQILSIVGVLFYTLVLGFALLTNRLPAERSYLLIALPCLVPAVWYLIGFLKNEGGDIGLVASSLGWFLVTLALLTKHLNIQAALGRGIKLEQISDTPSVWLFALLAIAGIVGGAVLSTRYWMAKSV
ncbi:hypothetical protein EON80_27155 [bacterium]|nr:MAG: hypothetical protein EON80_27155 [bacterium]